MATYDAELLAPPPSLEASKDAKPAEITNEATTSTPRVSIESKVGIARRTVR